MADRYNRMEYCAVLGHQCPYAHGTEELRNPLPFGLYSQSSFQSSIPPEVQEWQRNLRHSAPGDQSIDNFKINLCPEANCKQKPCVHFHNAYDRRRDPRLYAYASTPCRNVYDSLKHKFGNPNNCLTGDACRYSHTKYEACYHPMFYKTQLCKDFMEQGVCDKARTGPTKGKKPGVVPLGESQGAMTSLLASNQKLAEDTGSLKSQVESAAQKVKVLRRLVACHSCQKMEKAVYLSCGHMLCEGCVTALTAQGSRKCPVCKTQASPLCRVIL